MMNPPTPEQEAVEDDAEPAGDGHGGETGFAALGLPARLLKTLDDLGFVEPTPIQVATIPQLLTGRDIVGVAQTGTGKTAAFGLPMLAGIDPQRHSPQGLVLAPTRELALQVARALQDLAAGSPHIHITAVYGGAPWLPQKRALQSGTHIVVGTPGRIIDHMDRGTLDLSGVHFVVLDEGDEMLRMGFAEEVDRILSGVPAERQIALFSATMPPEIQRTVEAHLHNPRKIAVTPQSSTVSSVDQRYAIVPGRHKVAALARVLATSEADAALVFVQTKAAAEEVGASLVQRGIAASVISGDVPQNDREKVVERLRSGQLDVVVATDVAARGLDVDRIGLVVNLDTPREVESYVHRIGRTGRAGRTGVALSFITPKERERLRRIEKATKTELTAVTIPTPTEVNRHRVASLLARVPTRLDSSDEVVRRAVEDFLQRTGAETPVARLDARPNGSRVDATPADVPTADAPRDETRSAEVTPRDESADDSSDDVPAWVATALRQGWLTQDATQIDEPTSASPIDWDALEKEWNTGPLWAEGDDAEQTTKPGQPTATGQPTEPTQMVEAPPTGSADLAERAIDLATALVELAISGRGVDSLDDEDMDEELARLARRGHDRGKAERPPKGGKRDRGPREPGRAGREYGRGPQSGASSHHKESRPDSAPGDRHSHHGGRQPEFKRYWIGVGRRHGAKPGAIVGALTNEGGLHGRDLGRVDMFAGFSIVEIAPRLTRQTLQHLARTQVAGQPLRIRPDFGSKER